MADSYTPHLNLTLVEIGASRDTWGAKLNANTTALDSFVSQAMPVGAILDFAGPNAPPGWLVCDGRLISRTTFSNLFAVISTYWGAGDGSTTFRLPPTMGRASVGPGNVIDQIGNSWSFAFTETAGNVYNLITQAHLPNYALYVDTQGYHSHAGATQAWGAHYHTTDAQGNHNHPGTYFADPQRAGWTDTQGDHTHSVDAWATSGGGALALGTVPTQGGVTTSVAGAHGHNVGVYPYGNISVALPLDGYHAHTTTWVGDHAHGIYGDGNHTHNVTLGGSGAYFEVLSPIIVMTKIIYAGQQAAVPVVGVAAPAGMQLEGHAEPADELALLREELAQLRAQMEAVFAPARPRLLAAPLRGPH